MKSHVDIKQYTTIKMGGLVPLFSTIKKPGDIPEFIKESRTRNIPYYFIGGGSNIIFKENLEIAVAKMEIKGIEILKENSNEAFIKCGAGENWKDVIEFCLEHNFCGIESLSGIPGTAGAAPIQNIGAYGSEICNTLEYVEAYDTEKKEFIKLTNKDCEFGYRDSIFKKNKGRWVITAIVLKLQKDTQPKIPEYKDVIKYFEDEGNKTPSLRQVSEAIVKIRSNKLPDPRVVPNSGSFFKNPIIPRSQFSEVISKFPDTPHFEAVDMIKIPAGFLIEKAGLKDKPLGTGRIKTYKNNALVFTNPNHATFADLESAITEVQQKVFEMFGVNLEPEVNIIRN